MTLNVKSPAFKTMRGMPGVVNSFPTMDADEMMGSSKVKLPPNL